MTILAFWSVDLGDLDIERHTLDDMSDLDAFDILWHKRDELNARFYDMESHYGAKDPYGLGYDPWIADSDQFQEDYNDEELDDGGWWTKVLHIPSDDVKLVINE